MYLRVRCISINNFRFIYKIILVGWWGMLEEFFELGKFLALQKLFKFAWIIILLFSHSLHIHFPPLLLLFFLKGKTFHESKKRKGFKSRSLSLSFSRKFLSQCCNFDLKAINNFSENEMTFFYCLPSPRLMAMVVFHVCMYVLWYVVILSNKILHIFLNTLKPVHSGEIFSNPLPWFKFTLH